LSDESPTASCQSGFTLLELLIVLVILGLVTALVPYVLRSDRGVLLLAAARGLADDLRTLREDAIHQRVVTAMVPGPQPGSYLFRPAGLQRSLPEDVLLSFQPAEPSLVGSAEMQVAFYPDGSSTGGILVLQQKSHRLMLRIGWLDGRISFDE
jgi:general secretion pathway protein H